MNRSSSNRKYDTVKSSRTELPEPVKPVKQDLFEEQMNFLENFEDWNKYFSLTSYDTTRVTGNYGEIKEVILKKLDNDHKIRENFYGPLLPIDLKYKYEITF